MKKFIKDKVIRLKQINGLIGAQGRLWLCTGIFASLLIGFVEYGVAGFIQLLMVNIGLMDASKLPDIIRPIATINIIQTCLLLVVIGLFRAVGQFFSQQSSYFFQNIVNTRLRLITLYEILVGRNEDFVPASDIHLRFIEIFPKTGQFVSSLSNFLVVTTQISFMLGGMFYLAWKETILGLIGLFFIGIVVKFFQRKIFSMAQKIIDEQERISKGIERVTRNWLFIRISHTQIFEYEKTVNQMLRCFNHQARTGLFTKLSSNLPQLFGTMLLAGIIYLSQKKFGTKNSDLLAFLYLFIRFIQNITSLVDSIGGAISVYPHFKRSLNLYNSFSEDELLEGLGPSEKMFIMKELKQDFHLKIKDGEKSHMTDSSAPDIIIDSLDFAWDEELGNVISNFNLELGAKKCLGITGESGCGKSTLLLLVLGIISPSSGSVKIKGFEAKNYLESFGDSIGYVGADPFLIDGTIKDNLLYGLKEKEFPDDKLWLALERARLSESLKNSNKNLKYYLNENGDGLSSGQKQRLAIARALLRNPSLLILDEASANLDIKTEEEIALTLRDIAKDCTMVIVSHRKGLLKYADNVIKLDD